MKTTDDPFGKIQAKGELQTHEAAQARVFKYYSEKQTYRKMRGGKNLLVLIQTIEF